jgi:hypothetical protein
LAIYYADMEGNYPAGGCPPPPTFCTIPPPSDVYNDVLEWLTVNEKYLTTIPSALVPDYHMQAPNSATIDCDVGGPYASSVSYYVSVEHEWGNETGNLPSAQWLYFFDPTQPTYGQVYVLCIHTDTKGTQWTSY